MDKGEAEVSLPALQAGGREGGFTPRHPPAESQLLKTQLKQQHLHASSPHLSIPCRSYRDCFAAKTGMNLSFCCWGKGRGVREALFL